LLFSWGKIYPVCSRQEPFPVWKIGCDPQAGPEGKRKQEHSNATSINPEGRKNQASFSSSQRHTDPGSRQPHRYSRPPVLSAAGRTAKRPIPYARTFWRNRWCRFCRARQGTRTHQGTKI